MLFPISYFLLLSQSSNPAETLSLGCTDKVLRTGSPSCLVMSLLNLCIGTYLSYFMSL